MLKATRSYRWEASVGTDTLCSDSIGSQRNLFPGEHTPQDMAPSP